MEEVEKKNPADERQLSMKFGVPPKRRPSSSSEIRELQLDPGPASDNRMASTIGVLPVA